MIEAKRGEGLTAACTLILCAFLGTAAARAQEAPHPGYGQAQAPAQDQAPVTAQACTPACRSGYVCLNSQCVSACNPPCAASETCNASGECVAPSPYAGGAPPYSTTPPETEPSHAGISVATGIGFGWALLHYSSFTSNYGDFYRGMTANGNLFTFGAVFQLDHGFGETVALGLRLGINRIVNSDNSSGIATQLVVGPALTFYVAQGMFIGLDLWLNFQSYDDIGGSITLSSGGDGGGGSAPPVDDIDGKTTLGMAVALRFGFPIHVRPTLAIVPEIITSVQPKTFVMDGTDVTYDGPGGSASAEASDALYVGVALQLTSRWYF